MIRTLLASTLLALIAACAPAEPDVPAPPPPAAGDVRPEAPPSGAPSIPRLEGAPRLEPVDEGNRDPSFAAFRDRLRGILARRDADGLLAIVAPDIRFTFGEGGGRDDFARHWGLRDGADSRVWAELEEVLSLGGELEQTASGPRFVAPYTFASWPEELDGFTHLAVTCEEAVARAEPSAGAAPLVRLDHHVLPIGPDDRIDGAWRQVVLPDGREGWIESRCARSHVDYRAAFERREGAWRMVFFVAGD